ncbi:GntR family transcriptional regulator [Ensifer adhaerens]|uniref:GntR family transcriptional regulator n=1 Tax=Ensifer adhaerens TaxID=106592 RepID=UPI001F3330BE|nr:GntR family transcriptional regulator [Ensifer adhaerens]MDF8357654.1 GntR family transcriptional regulator [Ensifer adhaerens]
MPEAIRPRSQSAEAYAAIRGEVLSGQIPPGVKIAIGEMSARLTLSAGSVREALSRLTAEGLVIAEPQRGFRASPISPEDLKDLTRTRARIESLCLCEAIANGDPAWEGRVLAAHHKLVRTPMLSMPSKVEIDEDWSAAHGDFHAALAEGCRSPWLIRVRQMLYEQSERYRRLSVPLDDSRRDVASEHRMICEAALAGDRQTAVRLLQEHIEATANIVLSGLAGVT